MRNIVFLIIIVVFIPIFLFTQTDNVSGGIGTTMGARISILGVFPDSFPDVSVVFRAETEDGEPVLNLDKNNVYVSENGQSCEVISVEPIAVKQPVLMSMVVDHSGSMILDYAPFFDTQGKPTTVLRDSFEVFMSCYDTATWPKGYLPPIERARAAVKQFVATFNPEKDQIGIVGFSTVPDKILPLTGDTRMINAIVDSLMASGSTALYSAMMEGLNLLDSKEGIPVMVVLTDGYDNTSTVNPTQVIARARELEIPVYVVGVGNVNKDTLQIIADSTDGEAFFIQSATALNDIYAKISRKVQSFYDLKYRSINAASADSSRMVIVNFNVPGLKIIENAAHDVLIPESVRIYLQQKEQERTYYLYGGILAAITAGAASLILVYKRKKSKSSDKLKVYPNPTDGRFTLEQPFGAATLNILNTSGSIVAQGKVAALNSDQDFSQLDSGTYILQLTATDGRQLTTQILIQK